MADADELQADDPSPPHLPRDVVLRRYLLRSLLWCGACDLPLIAVLVPPGARYYGCTTSGCAHRLVPANVLEQRVWSRFVAISQVLAEGVPRDRRHDVLCEFGVEEQRDSG